MKKHGALSDHQRLIRQCGVTPLMYQYGEKVIRPTREAGAWALPATPDRLKKSRVRTARGGYVLSVLSQFLHGSLFLPWHALSEEHLKQIVDIQLVRL